MSKHSCGQVVDCARQWLGTPYLHQASFCQVGTDCLGLIRGVWRELLGAEPESIPPYTPDWSETGTVEVLYEAALRHLIAVKNPREPKCGQVLLFRMGTGAVAKHLGICACSTKGYPTLIHAYSGRGVVETPLSDVWQKRIVAHFEFPSGVK